MSKQLTFNEEWRRHFKILNQYVPVVARVHGNSHPEFHEVRQLFDTIKQKINDAGSEEFMLSEEFANLREITNNYAIPDGVCGTYQEVYEMLAKVDKAYEA